MKNRLTPAEVAADVRAIVLDEINSATAEEVAELRSAILSAAQKAMITRWCDRRCYLDDMPAVIRADRQTPHLATVVAGDMQAKFPWHEVNRVMYGKMEFLTQPRKEGAAC